jgi:hypothetical protein
MLLTGLVRMMERGAFGFSRIALLTRRAKSIETRNEGKGDWEGKKGEKERNEDRNRKEIMEMEKEMMKMKGQRKIILVKDGENWEDYGYRRADQGVKWEEI